MRLDPREWDWLDVESKNGDQYGGRTGTHQAKSLGEGARKGEIVWKTEIG